MILGASLLSHIPNMCVAVDGGILAFLFLWRLSFLYLGYQQIQEAQRKHSGFASFDIDCQAAIAKRHFPNPIAVVLDSTLMYISGLFNSAVVGYKAWVHLSSDDSVRKLIYF